MQTLRDLIVRVSFRTDLSGVAKARVGVKQLNDSVKSLHNGVLGFRALWLGMHGLRALRAVKDDIYAAADAAAEFSKKLGEIATLNPNKPQDLNAMGRQYMALGAHLGLSAMQMVEAGYQVETAFGQHADNFERVKTVAKLAKVGLASTDEAMHAIHSFTKTYGDTTIPMFTRSADLLMAAVSKGTLRLPELVGTMQKMASLGGPLGIAREEMVAWAGTLAQVSGTSQQAGTQGLRIMLELVQDKKRLIGAVHQAGYKTGLEMLRAEGGIVGTLIKLKEVTKTQRAFLNLFSRQEALRGGLQILEPENLKTFLTFERELHDALLSNDDRFKAQTTGAGRLGHAASVAAAKMGNLKIALGQELGESVSDLRVAVARLTTGFELDLVHALNAAGEAGGKANSSLQPLLQTIDLLAAGVVGVLGVAQSVGGGVALAAIKGANFVQGGGDLLRAMYSSDMTLEKAANLRRVRGIAGDVTLSGENDRALSLLSSAAHLGVRGVGGKASERDTFGSVLGEREHVLRDWDQGQVVGVNGNINININTSDPSGVNQAVYEEFARKLTGYLRDAVGKGKRATKARPQ